MELAVRVILCNARAMGEFGAVSVVSGHMRGLTDTMPLYVEILYNDYQFVPAFAVASLLTLLAPITLVAKSLVEWKSERQLAPLSGSTGSCSGSADLVVRSAAIKVAVEATQVTSSTALYRVPYTTILYVLSLVFLFPQVTLTPSRHRAQQ